MDDYRVVTKIEIYNRTYLNLHKWAMETACVEAKEMSERFDIPIANFDISALTFQHYKGLLDRDNELEFERKKKQAELDESIRKEVAV